MSDGQISETSMMTTQEGADSIPGTDDGVPPAADAQHIPQGMPADYTDAAGSRSGIDGTEEERRGAS